MSNQDVEHANTKVRRAEIRLAQIEAKIQGHEKAGMTDHQQRAFQHQLEWAKTNLSRNRRELDWAIEAAQNESIEGTQSLGLPKRKSGGGELDKIATSIMDFLRGLGIDG